MRLSKASLPDRSSPVLHAIRRPYSVQHLLLPMQRHLIFEDLLDQGHRGVEDHYLRRRITRLPLACTPRPSTVQLRLLPMKFLLSTYRSLHHNPLTGLEILIYFHQMHHLPHHLAQQRTVAYHRCRLSYPSKYPKWTRLQCSDSSTMLLINFKLWHCGRCRPRKSNRPPSARLLPLCHHLQRLGLRECLSHQSFELGISLRALVMPQTPLNSQMRTRSMLMTM